MRERLSELLDIIIQPGEKTLGDIADHLIANGVTIQKWIPVTERLPEKSGAYLVATERDGVFVTHYSKRGQLFSISRLGVAITHWQERPLPPKEGD